MTWRQSGCDRRGLLRPLGGLRGVGVWTATAGAANANLRNGDRRVGLKASGCSVGLAAMIGHARRLSRHVTVKIVTLHVLFLLTRILGEYSRRSKDKHSKEDDITRAQSLGLGYSNTI